MSGGSAARVKFQSCGKFLDLDICCFVINGLSVVISHCFPKVPRVGIMRVYWKIWGKKNCYSLDSMWYKWRKSMSMLLKKSALFTLMYTFYLFCCIFVAINTLLCKTLD